MSDFDNMMWHDVKDRVGNVIYYESHDLVYDTLMSKPWDAVWGGVDISPLIDNIKQSVYLHQVSLSYEKRNRSKSLG